MEEIIIIGGGPAGYGAALYSMEANPLLFEGFGDGNSWPGGQLMSAASVDNYPGFPNGIEGPELAGLMKDHVVSHGLRIVTETVSSVYKDDENFVVTSEKGEYRAKVVIVATGASHKRLYVPGTNDDELWKKGVSSCVVCDGAAYIEKTVCVIGGGDSAIEAALYLSNIASKVYIIHRRSKFRARNDFIEKAKKSKNIEMLTPYVLNCVSGDEIVQNISIQDAHLGTVRTIPMDGVFFCIGHNPNTSFLKEMGVALDINGYITSKNEVYTDIPGFLCAGDVCDKYYNQVVVAVSSGAFSGIEALKYLKTLKK